MSERNLRPGLGRKKGLVRNRKINSCKRCYASKRKCDKQKPTCSRCKSLTVDCEYFPENDKTSNPSLHFEKHEGSKNVQSFSSTSVKPSLKNLLNTEINPQPSKQENQNFTLIISSTGEYSKFFPTCTFPFHDHQANLSMVLNFNDAEHRKSAVFDFSMLAPSIRSMNAIKLKIPSKHICDYLVEHFEKFVFPFVPIVDFSEFNYEYKEYWKNPTKYDNNNFLILLFALLFCSCTSIHFINELIRLGLYKGTIPEVIQKIDLINLRRQCFFCIENIKNKLNSDSTPSVSLIVCLSLIYYVGSSNGLTATLPISNLVKYSQIFGLHRRIVNTEELATRDIIYSIVWFLDSLSAYYSGFPPNMYGEIFHSDFSNLFLSNDPNILFLSARVENSKIWNRILYAFNKIKKSDFEEFQNVENSYLDSIVLVNSINYKILANPKFSEDYKKWLVTETRLGLRKSALMLSALRCSLDYRDKNNFNGNITTDLVLHAMLLINESIYKVKLGLEVMAESIWYYRFAIPFQAMYIVLSHVKKYPKIQLNFSMIDDELEYTSVDKFVTFSYNEGDIRMRLVEEAIGTLSFLTHFWHASHVDRFESIIKFRDYIMETVNGEDSMQNHMANTINSEQDTKGKDTPQNPTMVNIRELQEYLEDAYAFLDESSQFWYGDLRSE